MDIKAIVTNPLVVTAAGALAGYMLKAASDVWTSEAKRRQEFANHFVGQIESIAPTYYLMGNYAHLLSTSLNNYLGMKRELQLLPLAGSLSPYQDLKEQAERTAKEALFYAGKVYRVIHDSFWVKGGRYLLPDRWANKAIEDLHNGLMSALAFDPEVLFRYIKADTDLYEFYDALAKARRDLRDEYRRYGEWLLKQERQVIQVAVYAQAYSDLFHHQMDRLYKDYHSSELWRGAAATDPLKSKAVTENTDGMLEETRKCIAQAAQDRQTRQAERSRYFMAEIEADADTLIGEASFNLGWNFYTNQQFQLAEIAYRAALDKLKPGSWLLAAVHNNLGNVYTSTRQFESAARGYLAAIELDDKRSIFHRNLGWMYHQSESYERALEWYRKAAELEPENSAKLYLYNDMGNALRHLGSAGRTEAIEYFRRAIALDPDEPILLDNLAGVYQDEGQAELAIKAATAAVGKARVSGVSGEQAANYHYRLGCLYEGLAQPNWDKAIECYTDAVVSHPELFYLKALVEAYKRSEKLKDITTSAAIQMSKTVTPRTVDDVRSLADIRAMLGDDEGAAANYQAWIRGSWGEKLLRQGILLEYKPEAGQVTSYKLEVSGVIHGVALNEFEKKPLEVIATSQQKVLAVKPDGTYDVEVILKRDPPEQDVVMTMSMSRSGSVLASSQPGSNMATVPFPDREVKRGDTWQNMLPIPDASGKPVELNLVYKLAEIEMRQNRICAHITVSGSGLNESVEQGVQQQTTAFGDTWFDFEQGILVESHVESRVVITGHTDRGDQWASLTTMAVDLELIDDTRPGAAASEPPEPPQQTQA